LREDLSLHKGPSDLYGAPTWTLHDPARNRYFSLDWIAFEIMSRLKAGSAADLCQQVNAQTSLTVDEEDVSVVLKFLHDNELVARHDAASAEWLVKKRLTAQTSLWQKLIHSYLFFRVPLFKPNRLLGRLVSKLEFFYSRKFFFATAVVLVFGLLGVIRQWDSFTSTLLDTFSWNGIVGYAGALFLIKLLHEVGHALTAKRSGCRVPTMGVAFLVMLPMAYTDVTESWKLESHRKRLWIAAAGVATELIVAAWCLLFWTLLPDGSLRGVMFFLATTSLTATLAINGSPFMRFDGYFVLCDFLGMPNLHARSFALARWWLRERLLALGEPVPETCTSNQLVGMVCFAFAVWLYRMVVFAGIAVLVYHYFFKALGIILFIVEAWYFLLRPVVTEVMIWKEKKKKIPAAAERSRLFYVICWTCAFLLIPFDVTVSTQGLLKPEKNFAVIATDTVQLRELPKPIGTFVKKGEALLTLDSHDLEHKLRLAQVKTESLERQIGSAGFATSSWAQQAILKEQWAAAREELNGLFAQQVKLSAIAPFDGEVLDIQPDITIGDWLSKGTKLVSFADTSNWIVDCYIEESDLDRLRIGAWARFVPEAIGLTGLSLTLIEIERDATRNLTDLELGSLAGGQLLVRQQGKAVVPERAIYRLRLKVDGDVRKLSTGYLRGSVVILGWPQSLFGDFVRNTLGALRRELGF
jgi:putative peptide zinc metalloprotease protein